MTNQHPIIPPLALIDQWWDEAKQNAKYDEPIGPLVATKAARWGADQELEATLGLMATLNIRGVDYVRNARRSARAPSLRKSALHELNDVYNRDKIDDSTYDTIRRALEALDD